MARQTGPTSRNYIRFAIGGFILLLLIILLIGLVSKPDVPFT